MTAALVIGRFTVHAFTRYVRTPAGAKRYGVPIGSPIPVGRKVKARTSGEQGRSQAVRRAPTVKSEAGAKRYGVPVGSPIPIGRKVKKSDSSASPAAKTPEASKPANPDVPRDAPEPSQPDAPVEPAKPAVRRNPHVQLEANDKEIAERGFGGDNAAEEYGAHINKDGDLEISDVNEATVRLDELYHEDDVTDADRKRILKIQDQLDNLPDSDPPRPGEDWKGANLTRDYREKIPDLTYEEQGSLRNYTGSDYLDINNELRGYGGGGTPEDLARVRKDARVLTELANKYTTPGTIHGHRSIYDDRHLPAGDLSGQVITSPGFSSVAVDKPAPGYAHGDTHMEITIPPGMHGIDVGGTGYGSFGDAEREFVLPHNTRYRVDSQSYRDVDGIRQRVLKVTALPPLPEAEGAVAA